MSKKTHVSEQAKRRSELLDDIAEFMCYQLVNSKDLKKYAIPEETAKLVADEVALLVHENWRGLTVVFSVNPSLVIEKLKKQVLAEYNGRNITELVRKYRIAENRIYYWLNEEKRDYAQQMREKQGQLEL